MSRDTEPNASETFLDTVRSLSNGPVLHVDEQQDAVVERRRLAQSERAIPRILAELQTSGKLDALAANDASELPQDVRAQAAGFMNRATRAILSAFPNEGVGVAIPNLPELDVALNRTGISTLREPIVAHMTQDAAEFVTTISHGLMNNPILVALAAELAHLPEEVFLPQSVIHSSDLSWQAEIRLFVAYAYMLHAAATECLLEPKGGPDRPEASTFIHRMFAATLAQLDGIAWQGHVSLFERMKVPSIRHPFRNKYMDFKTAVRPFDDDASGGHSLQLNILEAMFQDTLLGWDDNANAGFELFCQSVDKAPQAVLGEDIVREWVLDGRPTGVPLSVPAFAHSWVNLYISWNAAFCASYDEMPFFLAKLFTPAVGAVQHDRHPGLFIYTRIVTLLLHITFVMTSRDETRWGERFSDISWHNDGLIFIWGRINRAAGDAYQRRVETALESQEGFVENMRYDAWRAGKVALWRSVQALTRSIQLTREATDAPGEAFRKVQGIFGLDAG